MHFKRNFFTATVIAIALASCTSNSEKATTETEAKTEKVVAISASDVAYNAGDKEMSGYVAFDSASAEKRPIVLIVHEWWGLGDYEKSRARQLAELGYLAFAVDMYGKGIKGETPDAAGKLATPFYTDPQLAKSRFDAALAQAKTYTQGDTTKIAAIGYCFGGAQVLNMARLGEDLAGVVSFHGNLAGVPLQKENLKAKVFVAHGEADQFVSAAEVANFKKQMDSIGAAYSFKSYPNATHAFTNPAATANGEKFKIPIAYNKAADTTSWNDMKAFFKEIF